MSLDNQIKNYKLKDFVPLIVIFLIIIFATVAHQIYLGSWNLHIFMNDFMAAFFIIFGCFKIINLKNFAEAYSTYDIIAKKFKVYAFLYPFIELGLGIAYLLKLNPFIVNLVTFFIMIISAVGVFIQLSKRQTIVCACLGTVFKIPMTYVTLIEDLIMALMALLMLLNIFPT